jgi:murein DD-endopeptidase MepM/ murein hydrolase activator NlpD
MRFPLPYVPTTSYKGANGFDGNRDNVRAGLRHAANDLKAPPGTPVLAMEDGVVLADPYWFFDKKSPTYAMEVKHSRFIARYCEIAATAEVKKGESVKEGQVIAFVGDQTGGDMLHLEFFSGKLGGALSFSPGTHPPHDRRDDVFDGVKFLDDSRQTATHLEGFTDWKFITDADGRKFLAPAIDEKMMRELSTAAAQVMRRSGQPTLRR